MERPPVHELSAVNGHSLRFKCRATRRIVAEGHEVGNHTWDNPQLSKLSDERATDEIEKTQDAIRTACGITPVLLRPPYGALNKPEHVWIPQRLKLNVIYWSVDTLDWKHPGAATITQRVLAGARPGAIILQHDIHGQTIDAMAAALDGLLAKGYRLMTISQAVVAILKNSKKPVKTADIYDALVAQGYKFTFKEAKKVLGIRLYKMLGVQPLGGGLFEAK